MNLAICCPSTGGHEDAVESWINTMAFPHDIVVDETITGRAAGYLQKAQKFYEQSRADVLAYFHSDLFIHEPRWDFRVLAEFENNPDVAVVSFFGARELGRPHIYTEPHPYDYRQLARGDCWSNMRDAEIHGRRNRGEIDVAMIDSFSLIVRRSFLEDLGGWPVNYYYPSHCSDMWLCCMAARHKQRVRMVGVSCTHNSGGVRGDGRFVYADWAKNVVGLTDQEMHQRNHRFLYDDFRDVLPIKVA